MDPPGVKRQVFCVDVCLDRDNTSDQQSTNAAPEVLAITSEGASSSCCSVQGTNCQALKAASARTQAHRGFSISGRHAVTCFHFGTIAVRSATTYANVDAACCGLDVMGCRVCDVELLVPRRNSSLSPHGLRYFGNGDTIISNYYESPFAFSKAATLHPPCVSFCEAAH